MSIHTINSNITNNIYYPLFYINYRSVAESSYSLSSASISMYKYILTNDKFKYKTYDTTQNLSINNIITFAPNYPIRVYI